MTKSVFISGVSGGIGSAIARTFKADGWHIVGADIRSSSRNDCSLFYRIDIADAVAVKHVRDDILSKGLRLKCIINCAATQTTGKLLDTTDEDWNLVIRTNLGSVFLTTRYLAPLLDRGSIINISSVHARATSVGLASYVASKGAICALTRAMALELSEHGIRVNAIMPGAIDTPMLQEGFRRTHNPEQARDSLVKLTPLQRLGDPEDIAHLALFLADWDRARNITGQEFVCDGGVLAKLASEPFGP